MYKALKTQLVEKQYARSLSLLVVERLLECPLGFERSFVQLLKWIYVPSGVTQNNRAEDILTHHASFLEGVTGKDERLYEDTNASKVSVCAADE